MDVTVTCSVQLVDPMVTSSVLVDTTVASSVYSALVDSEITIN